MDETSQKDYAQLQDVIRPHRRALVAFSGGVDSSLVLKAALDTLGSDDVLGVVGSSPSLARRELEQAQKTAEEIGASLRVITTNELSRSGYVENSGERCFHCKTELYSRMDELRRAEGYEVIFNGANLDDQSDYRPGQKAAAEWRVSSPLLEAGLSKEQVRRLARSLELAVWDKPAAPCLSSRIPYFQQITPWKLKRVERAEDFLVAHGFREFRVRCHEDFARLELPVQEFERLLGGDLRERLLNEFKQIGFRYTALDLNGLNSGGFNQALEATEQESE